MKLDFWAKVGFAMIFAGLILDIWLGKADIIIWFGLCLSFSCFIDIDRERKKLEHIEWIIDSDYELEILSNIFIRQCEEIYENSFAKYADILFKIKSTKIYEFDRASLIRVQENYIQAILDLSEEYKDFTKKYKDLKGRDIRVPEESKTKYLNNLKKIVDTFKCFSNSMRDQTDKLYFKE